MKWQEVRAAHPDQWLVVEAIRAHHDGRSFVVDDASVVARCSSGSEAMATYRRLRQLNPGRDILFIHTSQEELAVEQRSWAGVRTET